MSYFTLEGTLHKIFDTVQKTDSFRVREFVVVTEDRYPQTIKFQLSQDRCESIDTHSVGDPVSVDFNVVGKEWNDKYFVNLNAFRIAYGNSSSAGNSNSVVTFDDDDVSLDKIPF